MWIESFSFLSLLPASSVLQRLVALFLALPDFFSNNMASATAAICMQLSAVWVDACDSQVPLADILKA